MTDAESSQPPASPASPPAVPGSPSPELRASDADRERVAEVLREAMAEGRLDMDEFNERVDAAYRARTYGDLAPLTRDLPAAGAVAPKTSLVKRSADDGSTEIDWAERVVEGTEPTSGGAFAFWSGFNRKGGWTVGRLFTSFAMWGGGEIDLREARFADREVVIRCFTIMGGIQVTVPPELNVSVKGFGIMGGFGDDATGEGTPGSPRVTVTGFALMGGVNVERKLRKAERQRLKEQRRQERLEERESRRLEHRERHQERHERHKERHELHRRRAEDNHHGIHGGDGQ
ncbi:DUF1707 SHOCT-like domain-containing protein [Streptomyces spectabilis]|uniref:DUF1707 and DUF2154 domain-containing protein n=1 Tax=Streptomyces spectabilis TaxID=68270 RepID=A0A5P2XCK5_STRST|nr:DUF1707 domain-containing protein [Streptomyces spectabilis]MBB5106360.1 hypothetical protein [Streptomyces spectabilis]MCI3902970.1 DUF1707 domain-containing protein [Streptomyces spectabilis]QEV60236.1 DUF1707 and DUF2154 domain-containing protein [Streptomyces spectabilis]GGV33165.1 hypothetical protein GCM10010245_53540 [Streptomyces spectabilis]